LKLFCWSDIHFNHTNILKYCDRKFDNIEEHDDYYIKIWNKNISNEDTIYYLGDFLLSNKHALKKILEQLNGKKVLIRGNHDRFTTNKYITGGFSEVVNYKIENIDSKIIGVKGNIFFSHYPFSDIDEYKILYNKNNCVLNIHGHLHNKTIPSKEFLSVCCDVNKNPVRIL